jgi:protein-disulfide isomerase
MELLRRMPDELALEFHHWPIPVSRNSPMASQAAEAAGEQGMYWEMHDAVFERLNEWSGLADGATYFTNLAGELGLDTNRFRQDMMSEAVMNRVIADMSRGRALGVDSTPTFFLDGQFVDLPADPAQAEALLRAMGGL